jgi:hypothetical protein
MYDHEADTVVMVLEAKREPKGSNLHQTRKSIPKRHDSNTRQGHEIYQEIEKEKLVVYPLYTHPFHSIRQNSIRKTLFSKAHSIKEQ